MVLKPRPVDLTEVEPQNIRHSSHRGTAADLRVIVREHEASEGGMYLPGGTSHFWLEFRPAEAPERMLVTFKDTQERCFVDRSLHFFAPGQPHAVEWRGGRGPVVLALAAGFADQAHLTRHFQRVFGQARPLAAAKRVGVGGNVLGFVQNGPQLSRFCSRRMANGVRPD